MSCSFASFPLKVHWLKSEIGQMVTQVGSVGHQTTTSSGDILFHIRPFKKLFFVFLYICFGAKEQKATFNPCELQLLTVWKQQCFSPSSSPQHSLFCHMQFFELVQSHPRPL